LYASGHTRAGFGVAGVLERRHGSLPCQGGDGMQNLTQNRRLLIGLAIAVAIAVAVTLVIVYGGGGGGTGGGY